YLLINYSVSIMIYTLSLHDALPIYPDVSIRLISNGQNKLYTTGNRKLKDMIYTIYGREVASNLIPVHEETETMTIDGFLGKPVIDRKSTRLNSSHVSMSYAVFCLKK